MAKFQMVELAGITTFMSRVSNLLGDAVLASIFDDVTERGKFMKHAAESRFILAVAGDEIETLIESVNTATADGYSVAALRDPVGPGKFLKVTFDGVQATPGTGVVTLGGYCLVGTVVPKGTALTGPARVTLATSQAAAKSTPFAWRVVSLGSAGTGAVGTTGILMRVGA